MNILKRQTILIVEDEASLRNALTGKFTREGFIVFDAKDGEVGLAVAKREKPNLILLDIVMPKMDGMTMLKNLRTEKEWGRVVPVMLLTNLGSDDKEMAKEIIEDEFTQYLVKSNWAINDVVKKVRERLLK